MRCRIKVFGSTTETGSDWHVYSGGKEVGAGHAGSMDDAYEMAIAYATEWKRGKPKEARKRRGPVEVPNE